MTEEDRIALLNTIASLKRDAAKSLKSATFLADMGFHERHYVVFIEAADGYVELAYMLERRLQNDPSSWGV